MQIRPSHHALLLAVLMVGASCCPSRADADEVDEQAKALVEKYAAEGREKTWGAFRRRLDALRGLGPLDSPRAHKALLKVAKKGRTLDDRLLAAQGLARHGDLACTKTLLGDYAKRAHPVLTEGIGRALSETKDAAVLAWLSGSALDSTGEVLAVVMRAHAALGLEGAAPQIAARYEAWGADGDLLDVAFDAVRALGPRDSPASIDVALAAASHENVRLRLAAADVLARKPAAEQVASSVRRLLSEAQPVVRRAMAAGIRVAKAETYVPDLAGRLGDEDLAVRKAVLDALRQVSGKDFGFDAGAWLRWFANRDLPTRASSNTVPTYHGIGVFSEHVVFILDRSGSMMWPHAPGVVYRMEMAQDALVKVLGDLPKRTRFNLLAFDSKVFAWKKGAVPADDKAVKKAVRWVGKQEARKGASTNTYGALERALEENPGIDTIYLLSDGIPEDGEITTSEGLLAAVANWNRFRRVRIHTIALTLQSLHPGKYPITSSMRRAAAFMKELARAGGGEFRLVNNPPPGRSPK